MSLDVSPTLLSQAESGEVSEIDFIDTVRRSLPYAYEMISGLAVQLQRTSALFVDNTTPPASEAERGQLLRAMASNAIRASLERHFGVHLAFQNCHRVAVFRTDVDTSAARGVFTSIRGQLLNQSPVLRDC
ncbi:SCO5389 family protein [Streptomyces chartreusis]|uniref:SCO5389 family protein n=1 Tax=Streptomyces chartreusis TaxID=1969 RepID=UPI00382FA65B